MTSEELTKRWCELASKQELTADGRAEMDGLRELFDKFARIKHEAKEGWNHVDIGFPDVPES